MKRMKRIPLSKVIKLSITFFVSGFLLVLIGAVIGDNTMGLFVIITGWIALLGASVIIAVFYRCPHCGAFLTVWYFNSYCPQCREPLS